MTYFIFGVWGLLFLIVLIEVARSVRIVPTQSAFIVERLGQYKNTLEPGFHLLVPFLEKVAFIQQLKEEAVSVPPPRIASRKTTFGSR